MFGWFLYTVSLILMTIVSAAALEPTHRPKPGQTLLPVWLRVMRQYPRAVPD